MAVELATAYVQILPSFRGGQAAIARGITPPATAAGESAGTEAGKKFSGKFALAAKVGLLAAGAGVGLFAKSAVTAASDVNESQSKVGVVFGKSSQQVIDASKTSAAALGLSTGAYLEATGTLGNLLVSLKVAPKAAADMSQQMVTLAGDLASFNNVSPEEALAAIKSGLVGETEPLRAFGVNMNDATLRAQALKLHLIKTTKDALTPQVKALAAQALIMDQTKTAQGDFARTSGGLANQQRILAAQFDDVKAKVGKALLPIMVKLANFLTSKVLPAFQVVSAWVQEHWPEIKDAIVNTWKQYIQPVFAAIGTFITTKVIPAIKSVVDFVVQHWPQIKQAFVTAWGVIKPMLDAFADLLKTIWTSVLQPIVAWVQAHWSQISTVIKVVFVAVAVAAAVVVTALKVAFRIIAAEIRILSAVFRWLWNNIVTPVFNGIKTVISGVWTVIKPIFKAMADAFSAIGTAIQWAWDHVIHPVLHGISAVVSRLWTDIEPIIQLISDAWGLIGDGLQWAWDHAISPILKLIKDGIQEVKDLLDSVTNFGKGGRTDPRRFGGVSIPFINAAGTEDFPGGWSWVGEKGPELLQLPQHAKIRSNAASMAMVSAPSIGGGGSQTINLVVDGRVLASVVTERQLTNARRS